MPVSVADCPSLIGVVMARVLIVGATLRHSATWDQHLPTELILAHIGGAFAVTLALGGAAINVLRRQKGYSFLTRPATIALVLLGVQLLLGLAAYLTRSRGDIGLIPGTSRARSSD